MDYEKLGFKAGIEIHQELDTGKLFCRCSSALRETNPLVSVSRKLKAVAGEAGEIDVASYFEELRDRTFIYQGFENEACLVDLDEEPPNSINPDALAISLGVCKMLRLKIPGILCVMRKTVTDGSAISGFQRTVLVGIEGKDSYIDTEEGKVKIVQLNLEEDACKVMRRADSSTHYSLSRLGIPLLEIGTDASLKNPGHVKEAALKIGTLLRSFNVKRGIGTIRQDVNVSIKGGARVEVKGWQDLRKLEDLVVNEAQRQQSLLKIKAELERRGFKKIRGKVHDVTALFSRTDSKLISGLLKSKAKVYALVLPRFKGLLKNEVCHGKTFGRELSEYAKAYGTKGIIHSDEDLSRYNLDREFMQLGRKFKVGQHDLVLVVAEAEEVAKKALEAVKNRANYCIVGVPEETRTPNHEDATSSFARPLPGSHRLYPETDIPNIPTEELLGSIEVPEYVEDRIERLSRELKIDRNLVRETIDKGFDIAGLSSRYKNIEPRFIAHTLVESQKEIKKRYQKDIAVEGFAEELFERLDKGQLSKEGVFEILVDLAHGKGIDYSKYAPLPDSQLEAGIVKIIEENRGLPLNAVIGKAMGVYRGKADGRKIVELLKAHYGK